MIWEVMRLSRTLRYMVAGGATLALVLTVLGTAHAGGIGQGAAESIAMKAVGNGSTVQDISLGTAGGAAVWNAAVRSAAGVSYAVRIAQADGVVMRVQVLDQVPSESPATLKSSAAASQTGSEPAASDSVATGGALPPLPPGPPGLQGRHKHAHHDHGQRFAAPPGWSQRDRHGHFGVKPIDWQGQAQDGGQGRSDGHGDGQGD